MRYKASLVNMLSVLTILSLWTLGASADEIVHVSFVDGQSVTEAGVARNDALLEKRFPRSKFSPLRIDVRDRAVDDELLAKVQARLAEADDGGGAREKISLIVMELPERDPAELGAFGELLKPFAGRLRPHGRLIVLGSKRSIDAEALMTELGAPDGSVFTLITKPRRDVTTGLGVDRFKTIAVASVGLGAGVAALAAAYGANDAILPLFGMWSVGSTAALSAATVIWDRVRPWLEVFVRRADYGRLVSLSGGRVTSEIRMSALRRKVLFRCEDRL